jgi:hypothetical protein
MHTMRKGYRGLSLLLDLNWDRALYVATITVSLGVAAWVATLIG